MMMILTERGHSFTTTAVRVIVRDAEVKLAYSRWTSTASCRPQRGARTRSRLTCSRLAASHREQRALSLFGGALQPDMVFETNRGRARRGL